ncbi:Bug family tripartite tricarboxylate transporter substrate binding protein [Sabulicella rubraurantiaca]|uniref:Bug family tripartite tricarboxylate transporter substrate binding protein n=1 Tax=Sabulicella rubraurantiaca TaxID=2811429 RepID=UPI001A9657E4|nr:tripartite tricarboxylate transporter substrate-binding protein [Sabulicella rubraurantiaca]
MRRRILLGSLLATPALAQAQWSPTRTIRLVAPYAPGGGVDTAARLLAGPMGALLGQTVVVENRGGAGGSIGAAEVARAAPDGHTVMVDALAHTVNPALMRGLPFDYATAFTPISQILVWPQILIVHPSMPVRNLQEFVAHVRARPGQLSYGSSGNATAAHLASALLLSRAGLDMTHVPYRGGAPALQDLVAGNIAFVFGTVASSLQLAQDGRVRAIAVSSAQRIAGLPDVGTVAEQGFPGYELNEWNGLYAPAGLPAPAVARWHEAVRHALADTAVQARLNTLGAIPLGSPPEEFARYVRAQRDAMATLVRDTRITIE